MPGTDFLDNTTESPVGGCPLSTATDDYGRLRGDEKLYVADGSLIPRGVVATPHSQSPRLPSATSSA